MPASPATQAIFWTVLLFLSLPLLAILYGVIGGVTAVLIVKLQFQPGLGWTHATIAAFGNAVFWSAALTLGVLVNRLTA